MNEELRTHVTRVGFDLSLGKTHIAALVWLEELRLAKWDAGKLPGDRYRGRGRNLGFGNFITGAKGLQDRGLLIFNGLPPEQLLQFRRKHPTERLEDGSLTVPYNPKVWKVTKAGRAVVMLLKESGLYDEYAAVLHAENEAKSA